jgi:hypothetical protein
MPSDEPQDFYEPGKPSDRAVYGPWYSPHYSVLKESTNGPVVNDDEAQFRHLIQLVNDADNHWSEAKDGYLLFFHIRVPTRTDARVKTVKGQPQILRASVYHLEPHVNGSKPVKRVETFPSASAVGKAAQMNNQFHAKVKALLAEREFTLREEPPESKGKGKAEVRAG